MKLFLRISILNVLLLLVACAGPRYSGSAIPQEILSSNPDVLSIKDKETREGFQNAVESWLTANSQNYVVKPESSQYDPEKLTIEYVGYWKWDLALYLSKAEIEAFYEGQRVSKVEFIAPNSLNTNKWGNGEARIKLMLDIMFGKKTAKEATSDL